MGLFGGNKTSSTQKVTNNANTTVTGSGVGSKVTGDNSPMLDNSYLIDTKTDNDQRITGINNSTVNLTDQGAVADALKLARAESDNRAESFADVLGWADQMQANDLTAQENLYDFAERAVQQTSDSIKGAYAVAGGKGEPFNVNTAVIATGLTILGGLWLASGKGKAA